MVSLASAYATGGIAQIAAPRQPGAAASTFMNTLVPTAATFSTRARTALRPCSASAIPSDANTSAAASGIAASRPATAACGFAAKIIRYCAEKLTAAAAAASTARPAVAARSQAAERSSASVPGRAWIASPPSVLLSRTSPLRLPADRRVSRRHREDSDAAAGQVLVSWMTRRGARPGGAPGPHSGAGSLRLGYRLRVPAGSFHASRMRPVPRTSRDAFVTRTKVRMRLRYRSYGSWADIQPGSKWLTTSPPVPETTGRGGPTVPS